MEDISLSEAIRWGAGAGLCALLAWQALLPASLPAQAGGAHAVVDGLVYYSTGVTLQPLEKVASSTTGGAFSFSRFAKVSGAHSPARVSAAAPQRFKVCGADPTRYKLYGFQSSGQARTLKVGSVSAWKGAVTSTKSRFEIPLTVTAVDARCFQIIPEQPLSQGEYGFNTVDSNGLFMFGVDGDPQVSLLSTPVDPVADAPARDAAPQEVGVVYYADGSAFRPLAREVVTTGGRPKFTARLAGAHSPIRLTDGQHLTFKVCGVDPTRYKLYAFESSAKERTMVVARVGLWGTTHDVTTNSEVSVEIQPLKDNCYSISTKAPLKAGEYGFSPVGAEDVFMFGVGNVRP